MTSEFDRVNLHDVASGLRFLAGLPRFLRHPLSLEQATHIQQRRRTQRTERFLSLVRTSIGHSPTSTYRRLFQAAGCEIGDVERLVAYEGVEGTLHVLCRAGIYLTVEEVKGRAPAVRGSTTVEVGPRHLQTAGLTARFPQQTSGSSGRPATVEIDLASLRPESVDMSLSLHARGAGGWVTGKSSVPGSAAISMLLKLAAAGFPPTLWFSPVDPYSPGLHPRYRWSTRALRWGSTLAQYPLPGPINVPVHDAMPMVRWMRATLDAGRIPHLWAASSIAVRVCQAGLEAGIDLHGAQFTLGGEPTTEARRQTLDRAGVSAVPSYSSIESGTFAHGCLAPEWPDDLHLFDDFMAVIQPDHDESDGPTLPTDAILLTSLSEQPRLTLLNVSLGDRATLVQRRCGCPLDAYGWSTHLHTVRSFEKLTGVGMTFLNSHITSVLEQVLPARFGGGPTDYQLFEEETRNGEARIRLVVHPRLGEIDEQALKSAFFDAIGPGSGVEQIMARAWRAGVILQIERKPPMVTQSGKTHVLHLARPPDPISI